MRSIDADELKKVIMSKRYLVSRGNVCDFGMFMSEIINTIDKAPTVNKKPLNKNKCIDCEYFYFADDVGLGICHLKDPDFHYTRKKNSRACKNFVKETNDG